MTSGADFRFENPRAGDVERILQLYFAVYGPTYPVAVATDRARMAAAISSPDHFWYIAREAGSGEIVGSVFFEIDRLSKIAKVAGLVVHPERRRLGVAHRLVSEGSDRVLSANPMLNSIYTLTRTESAAPQLIMLQQGFVPLGIFPNAHKVREYETLTLLVKYRPGVLERRVPVQAAPQKLAPILSIVGRQLGLAYDASLPQGRKAPAGRELDWEAIYAPAFVRKRFMDRFSDAYDRFFPFHVPNFLCASSDGSAEIYAYLNRTDHYCAIVSNSVPFYELGPSLRSLFRCLRDHGVSYVEVLMGLERTASIEALLEQHFIPSAAYPAMQEREGRLHDFVLLSRTMEPLNFHGMEIERSFKPYVDQYVELWKQTHIEALEVFQDLGRSPPASALECER
jgi:GNAT superfamily N-acetyltransferase